MGSHCTEATFHTAAPSLPSPITRAVIIATGSEVPLALAAQQRLGDEDIAIRVVSMPSTSVFDRQSSAYRQSVLPEGLPCVSVEAGVRDGWYKYLGCHGRAIGIDHYGESAPAEQIYEAFGLTVANVIAT